MVIISLCNRTKSSTEDKPKEIRKVNILLGLFQNVVYSY